jgi:membrane-bound inhibitor of C-type lysozyme
MMNPTQVRGAARLAMTAASLALAGCSSMGNLWPFGESTSQELSRTPKGATEYRCNNDRRFYARFLDNGASVWVIFPEREFRLDKVDTASGTRYSNRTAILEMNENGEVGLRDGATIAFTGCKTGGEVKSDQR